MPIDEVQLSKRFPPSSLYHWADLGNLPSIRQHGLLSTERLISLAGLNGAERFSMLSQYRANRVELPNGTVIRDQTPMPPALLAKAFFVSYHEWSDQGWPVIEGQRRSRSVMPAEIVLEGHLPLEPFLTGMQKQP
jgi:hypothetical protein